MGKGMFFLPSALKTSSKPSMLRTQSLLLTLLHVDGAQGSGLSGSLFSRDEAMKMAGSGFGGEDGDDDDEYEEEDAADKPLTGKVNLALLLYSVRKAVCGGECSNASPAGTRALIQQSPCRQVQSAVTDAVEKAREYSQPLLDTAAQGVAAAKGLFGRAAGAVSSLTGKSKADSEL